MFFPRRLRRVVPAQKAESIELMDKAGTIVAQALAACRQAAEPGVNTLALDIIAETVIRDLGAIPSFKGYQGFPASICSSINDVVVHGIPSNKDIIQEGDIVSIDCGAIFNGWHADAAITIEIDEVDDSLCTLSTVTRNALYAGIEAMRVGNHLSDISAAIEACVLDHNAQCDDNIHIVEGFGGHGIGKHMHQDPYLPNEGEPHHGPIIIDGSTLAIEPMLALEESQTITENDGWTVRMLRGKRAAHWEHTIVATTSGPRILTQITG